MTKVSKYKVWGPR